MQKIELVVIFFKNNSLFKIISEYKEDLFGGPYKSDSITLSNLMSLIVRKKIKHLSLFASLSCVEYKLDNWLRF